MLKIKSKIINKTIQQYGICTAVYKKAAWSCIQNQPCCPTYSTKNSPYFPRIIIKVLPVTRNARHAHKFDMTVRGKSSGMWR